ncbi:hypothetical protein F5Y15DRAFT_417836 [Xylariaceae sp. FL0016]|nr:hypothetical protein F5Y15DRAFT_417836 [Xylariaceae sp. FL0016]
MYLLDLPAELIQRIIKETIPETFETVRLVCRTLNGAASLFLKQYLERRLRFRHIVIPGETHHHRVNSDNNAAATSFTSMDELLWCIAQDPVIARYIQTADFKGHRDQNTDLAAYEVNDQVRDLVHQSPYLSEAGVDPDAWLSHMSLTHDREGYIQIFLLTLLPNVTTLAPGRFWSDWFEDKIAHPKRRVMDAIVRKANSASINGASLSKLENLHPWAGSGYEDERWSLTACSHFMALNSLRNLHAGSVIARDDGYTGIPFRPLYGSFSPNLETIELFSSVMGRAEIVTLLQRTRNLQHFRLAHETKWHGCGYNWDVGASIAAIQDWVGNSLEELSITIEGFDINSEGTTLTDMTGFRKLKTLEIDLCLLCGPAYNKKTARPEEDDDDPPSGEPAMIRLIDVLPPTIESVSIHNLGLVMDEGQRKVLRKLIEGLDVNNCEQLPNLKSVLFVKKAAPREPLALFKEVTDAGCGIISKLEASPAWSLGFKERFGVPSS